MLVIINIDTDFIECDYDMTYKSIMKYGNSIIKHYNDEISTVYAIESKKINVCSVRNHDLKFKFY